MDMYPVVSVVTGVTVTMCNQEPNAERLAAAINQRAGGVVVRVGGRIPANPRYAGDPGVLDQFIAQATV